MYLETKLNVKTNIIKLKLKCCNIVNGITRSITYTQ